jgi:hypothetical protein
VILLHGSARESVPMARSSHRIRKSFRASMLRIGAQQTTNRNRLIHKDLRT